MTWPERNLPIYGEWGWAIGRTEIVKPDKSCCCPFEVLGKSLEMRRTKGKGKKWERPKLLGSPQTMLWIAPTFTNDHSINAKNQKKYSTSSHFYRPIWQQSIGKIQKIVSSSLNRLPTFFHTQQVYLNPPPFFEFIGQSL